VSYILVHNEETTPHTLQRWYDGWTNSFFGRTSRQTLQWF